MAMPTVAGNLKEWLQGLGLEKYADAFAREEIELDVVSDLTDADLQSLGIPMGPRKQILRAIGQRKGSSASAVVGLGAPSERRSVEEPERRQLTVMFCDLVGSTALSRQLDPEDMRELIRAYQDLVTRNVARFDGHIASFAGDGVKVYFGFPAALENQAERAIRSAKAISQEIGGLHTPAQEPLAVRIGIATGPVVVGDLIGKGAAQEELVVGETPNLAARLQTLADPGETVISATTRQLVGELFELQGPGHHQLKGFSEMVETWRVLRERPIVSRFDALRAVDAIPLFGRNLEIALLDERWALARQGKGQAVLLAGDPGIGKSRVAQEFSSRIARDNPVVLSYQCWPHFTSSTLHPFIERVERQVDRASEVGDAATSKPPDPQSFLLAGDDGDASSQPRERFFEAYIDYVGQLSRDRPVLFVIEDIHWADPSSLELLELLIAAVSDCRALTLLTFRPEFSGISRHRDHVTLLTLNRCDRDSVIAMVEHLAAGTNLPPQLRDQIAKQTDGVPLFVEELTKAIVEAVDRDETGLSRPAEALIPATLYDSLMVRLDRLGPAKKVAQLASAIGREFSYDVLHAISQLEHKNLEAALKDLIAAEIVYPLQRSPGAAYIFKHALVQDAAYQSLLAQQRRAIHANIADTLAEKFPSIAEWRPELLAHHFTLARQDRRAIPYWQLAGQRAVRMSSYVEASSHLNQALTLLRNLPEASKDAHQELGLLVALATVQQATRGYGAPEVAAAFSEAKELCHALGGSEHLITVLFGEWACGIHREPLDDVVRLSRRLRRVVRSSADVGGLLFAERALGTSLAFTGRFAQARLYLSHAAQAYDEVRDQKAAQRFGLDLHTASLAQLVMAEWALGHADEAAAIGKRAISHAEHIEHGNSLALAIIHRGLFLEQFENNTAQILKNARRLGELAEGGGFQLFLAWSRVVEGWALFELGERAKGIAQMEDGIRSSRATGSSLYQPYFLTLLASSYGAQSDWAKGIVVLDQAIRYVEDRDERWYAAEVYRVKGELLLRRGGEGDGALSALRRARDIAQAQKNMPFTRRALDSLAELDAAALR